MQRSGEMTPRRAAWPRSKREVWVGKRSVTWRAMSAPVAVMPIQIGLSQLRICRGGLLTQGGVGLVADDHRVGVGDLAGVAHEPLIGLDGDRSVGGVLADQQRLAEAGRVITAGLDLVDELVDEVAPVGEDQRPAGAGCLDEAHRGDGLAGAGGVLEPEPAVRARVIGIDDHVGVQCGVVLVEVPGLVIVVLGRVLVLVVFVPRHRHRHRRPRTRPGRAPRRRHRHRPRHHRRPRHHCRPLARPRPRPRPRRAPLRPRRRPHRSPPCVRWRRDRSLSRWRRR